MIEMLLGIDAVQFYRGVILISFCVFGCTVLNLVFGRDRDRWVQTRENPAGAAAGLLLFRFYCRITLILFLMMNSRWEFDKKLLAMPHFRVFDRNEILVSAAEKLTLNRVKLNYPQLSCSTPPSRRLTNTLSKASAYWGIELTGLLRM